MSNQQYYPPPGYGSTYPPPPAGYPSAPQGQGQGHGHDHPPQYMGYQGYGSTYPPPLPHAPAPAADSYGYHQPQPQQPQPPGGGYQGYFAPDHYPPPSPHPIPYNNQVYHCQHPDYYDDDCSSFLRGCLTALCFCCVLEECF